MGENLIDRKYGIFILFILLILSLTFLIHFGSVENISIDLDLRDFFKITGFSISEVNLNVYMDDVSRTYKSNAVYLWEPEKNINIKSLTLVGQAEGTGQFKAYLISGRSSYLITSIYLENETINFTNICINTCRLRIDQSDKYMIRIESENIDIKLDAIKYYDDFMRSGLDIDLETDEGDEITDIIVSLKPENSVTEKKSEEDDFKNYSLLNDLTEKDLDIVKLRNEYPHVSQEFKAILTPKYFENNLLNEEDEMGIISDSVREISSIYGFDILSDIGSDNNYSTQIKSKRFYDAELIFDNLSVKRIKFNDLIIENNSIKLGIENFEKEGSVQAYAIDPTYLNFTDAVVSVVAKGTILYKCEDWNFTLQECFGDWMLFKTDLIPGQEYEFILTPDDPGFIEVIEITKALHLDENRNIISDIYDLVKEKDDIWSPIIRSNEYVRVTFEKELNNRNDITIFPRVVSGSPRIEVFEENKDEVIAEFLDINNNEYNKVYLKKLKNFQDTFDLKVIGGDVEFDHIIDPFEFIVVNYSTNGNWIVPDGVTEIVVEAWGAGGAGGGSSTNGQGGAGGGGGQYARRNISVIPGQSFSITIGSGGIGSTGVGTSGGDTTLNSTIVVAKGGTGGSADDVGTAGVGNQAGSFGDVIYFGGSGSNVVGSSGGGGGGAGSSGVGGSASGITAGTGNTELGGDGGMGLSAGGGSNPGKVYGGGGSGGRRQGNTATGNAGNGANGFLRISYTSSFCGGNGTINDPYLICDAEGLNVVRYNLSAHYKLNNSINLDVNPYNTNNGWFPIGNSTNPFVGHFNGSGYIISNLYINRSTTDYVGLFGYLHSVAGVSSVISSFGLEDVNITGNGYTGGLAGYITGVWNAESKILESYVTGKINGGGNTGCLIGYTAYRSYVNNSYVICNVTGGWGTGGISGSHWGGQIINSYAIVEIGGSGGGRGGVTGQGSSTVTNSYWNVDLFATSSTGEGKTTQELKNISTFNNWNIIEFEDYDDEIWYIKQGQDFPRLGWENRTYLDPISLEIISPISTTYTNQTQLVNITATGSNIDTIWYNWNGTNFTYTQPINITFNEGSNNLYAWVNDTSGNINSTSVTFIIDVLLTPRSVFVQRGENILTTVSQEVAISEVDSSKSFVILSTRSSNSAPENILIAPRLVNNTTLGLYRYGTASAIVRWEIIELPDSEVQEGVVSFGTTGNKFIESIDEVDSNKSFIVVYSRLNTATNGQYIEGLFNARFVNNNQIEFTRNQTGNSGEIYWQVISIENSNVQSGSVTLSGISSTETISSVNVNNSFVIFSTTSDNTGLARYSVYGQIINETSVDFVRTDATNNAYIEYFVVEDDRFNVQRGQNSISSATSPLSQTIEEVQLNRTFMFSSWRTTGTGTVNANRHLTYHLEDVNETFFVKGTTAQTQTIEWQVIEIKEISGLLDIQINSPINTTYNNATQLVNINTVGDNIDTIWYNWNGTNITYTAPVFVTFNEGSNTLYAWTNDTNGNLTLTNVTFYIDSISPEIIINSPQSTNYYSEDILVDIFANDTNLDSIWYNWNGTNFTYTLPINITFDSGENTLYVWANDTFGNLNNKSVTFFVLAGIYNGVPFCYDSISPCIAGSELLKCRNGVSDGNGPEPNFPNTIDDCTDGTAIFSSPSCGGDESVENITIINNNDNYFRKGDSITVSSWVHCYGSDNYIGLIYTNNASDPNWEVIQVINDACTTPGYEEITFNSFSIDNLTGDHVVRVYITYDLAPDLTQTCAVRSSGNRYDDNDDVVFRVLDHLLPNITINTPENRTYINFTILLNISASSRVGIDSIWYNWNGTNFTYTQPINITFNEGSNTLYVWANNTYGLINSTNVTFVVQMSNTPPNTTFIELNSTNLQNKTDEDLTCYAMGTDLENSTLKVYYRWYNHSVLFSEGITNNVQNDTLTLITTLDSSNTEKSDNWTCSILFSDGLLNESEWNNKSLTIKNSLPTIPNLLTPFTNYITVNRTPELVWNSSYDADDDLIFYEIIIERIYCQEILECSVADLNITTQDLNLTLPILDVDAVYYWKIRACDDEGCSSFSENRNFTINSLIAISFPVNIVEFGQVKNSEINDTTNNLPPPLIVQNDGNIIFDVAIYANKSLWSSSYAQLNTSYFQFKIDNTSELNSFNYASSQTTFANLTNVEFTCVIDLKWQSHQDSAKIDLRIEVPSDEPAGKKETNIHVVGK